MNEAYRHHKDAISMAKAIGDLPYEIIGHADGSVQYMVFITPYVKVSVIRVTSHHDWLHIDYNNDSNYEIAIIIDGEVQHESVQGYLNTNDIGKLLLEFVSTEMID